MGQRPGDPAKARYLRSFGWTIRWPGGWWHKKFGGPMAMNDAHRMTALVEIRTTLAKEGFTRDAQGRWSLPKEKE